jgi:hypothetical protein
MRLDILNSRQFTYPGQHWPQKRFFAMRAGEERVFVAVNGEIGNAVPARVFHRLEIRWTIPANFTRADIMAFYKNHKRDFKAIHDGFYTGYINGNESGGLTVEAEEANLRIESDLMDLPF